MANEQRRAWNLAHQRGSASNEPTATHFGDKRGAAFTHPYNPAQRWHSRCLVPSTHTRFSWIERITRPAADTARSARQELL